MHDPRCRSPEHTGSAPDTPGCASDLDGIRFAEGTVLSSSALTVLFDVGWPGHGDPAWDRVLARSLTWITAHAGASLVGFVNVAGDGGEHAFLLDTVVHPDHRHRGVGRRLVRHAADAARHAGATWLHVDHEARLSPFYAACGFHSTAAGLLDLTAEPRGTEPMEDRR